MAKEKIYFNQELFDFFGKPVKTMDTSAEPEGTHPDGSPKFPIIHMTLLKACTNALANAAEGEKLTPEQKQKRWRLGMKIAKAGTPGHNGFISLKAEDITEILKCTDSGYQPLVSGVIRFLLDPSDEDTNAFEGFRERAEVSETETGQRGASEDKSPAAP